MKNILALILLIGYSYTSSAQGNSLQDSFNKALAKTENESSFNNFEAHFDGKLQVVQLNWAKQNGQQITNYTIEKSADKTSWQELAKIYGAEHNSDAIDYFQTDNQPIAGVSYYRLKQINKDGKESFSNIVPVKSNLTEEKVNLFPLAGNSQQVIKLSFENIKKEGQLLVVLRDIKGQEFYSKILMNVQADTVVAIPIESYIPKGDYLVIASSEDQMYSQNVRIQ
ncbi:MAG: hypothetical protein H6587_08175 [Flavobacteriales bacterium]|nr:hypothetical protein [Bdellovibrionales bacterium]MCB9360547.1 hypothetical protein [Flavobacteriales bacterium]MCB9364530.1 hypothetical protein [Flavobacteriales bacterium]